MLQVSAFKTGVLSIFSDILLTSIGIIISSRFKQIRKVFKINSFCRQTSWNNIFNSFYEISSLVFAIDDKLSQLIFLTYTVNYLYLLRFLTLFIRLCVVSLVCSLPNNFFIELHQELLMKLQLIVFSFLIF